MREHLYTGQRVDNKGWVEGSLLQGKQAAYDTNDKYIGDKDCAIIVLNSALLSMGLDYCGECSIPYDTDNSFEVFPETVRQFTGLCDKNGRHIFEGNIVHGTIVSTWAKREINCEVIYERGCFICKECKGNTHKLIFAKDIEVIGNKWDNPELLEEKE